MTSVIVLILGLAVTFAAVASILMIVAVSTDFWESTEFDRKKLESMESYVANQSYLDDKNGIYIVVTKSNRSTDNGNNTNTTFLRATYGGIWRICDRISPEFKETAIFKKAKEEAFFLEYDCFNYVTQYTERKKRQQMHEETEIWLVRMQNSAASCNIVAIMCMLTAIITGLFGVIQKQVSACMVTSVMYIVAGVFACFALVIMHTKINYMQTKCSYTLDPIADHETCRGKRYVNVGWSVPVAWAAFSFFLLAFAFWSLLSRCYRLEKAKSIL